MASTKKILIKLLVDNSSRKVLFAEAGKDFVDFLFGLLEFPLGSILALMFEQGVSGSGSLGKIYESVKNLDNDYLVSNQTRKSLLRPRIADVASASDTKHTLLKQFPQQEHSNHSNPFQHDQKPGQFVCSLPPSIFAPSPQIVSSFAGSSTTGVPAPAPPMVVEGYVKGVVTYMVMDDLIVKPMSNISSISLLCSIGVQNLSSVEEKTVEVDLDKGLKLLKASFESNTVLTDVFLPTMRFTI
ncbi:hypothetical protein RHSIM_Rhsim13G0083700 [Rhododendron simsii]|uniref:DUF674 family protein n=1 Tax=Rhododendron simsii TaxID=118357 RepID=A0A834G0A6_RHOSS|nr:hypothetical protein RHSIM_Rhsim13G0083700 [Rhododendron simsii]